MREIVASGGTFGSINLWDLEKEGSIGIIQAHGGPVTSLIWQPSSNRLIRVSEEGAFKVWELSLMMGD